MYVIWQHRPKSPQSAPVGRVAWMQSSTLNPALHFFLPHEFKLEIRPCCPCRLGFQASTWVDFCFRKSPLKAKGSCAAWHSCACSVWAWAELWSLSHNCSLLTSGRWTFIVAVHAFPFCWLCPSCPMLCLVQMSFSPWSPNHPLKFLTSVGAGALLESFSQFLCECGQVIKPF